MGISIENRILNVASSVLQGPLSPIFGGVLNSINQQSNNVAMGDGSVRLFDFAQNLGRLGAQGILIGLKPPSSSPTPFNLPSNILQNPMGMLQNMLGSGSPLFSNGLRQILEAIDPQARLTGFNPYQGSSPFFPEMGEARFNQAPGIGTTIMGPDPQDGVWTPPAGSNITLDDVRGIMQPNLGSLGAGAFPASRLSSPVNLGVEGQNLDSNIERVGGKAQSLMDQAQALANSDNPADQMKAQRMMQQAQRMIEFMSGLIKIIGDMQKSAIQNMR